MSDETHPLIAPSRTPEADAAVTPDPEPDALPAPGLVLVVDDDDLVRWGTARKLRRAGYEVLEAAGADEALICMQEHGASVSLVLSDVIMPKQTGYELCQAVNTRWPETQILLLSGYTPVAMDRHGIQRTGYALLQKPVPDLLATVTRLIGPPQV